MVILAFLIMQKEKKKKWRSMAQWQLSNNNCVYLPSVGASRGVFSPDIHFSALNVMLLSSRIRLGAHITSTINPNFHPMT